MAKHPKKRQRLDSGSLPATKTSGSSLEKTSQKQKVKPLIQPLGSEATLARLLDEESKDDEERKLESMLFGVPYIPSGNIGSSMHAAESDLVFDIDKDKQDDDGGRPMAGLLDSDVSCHSS